MIEKVNPSHPDKIADRIAGAIVDLAYQVQPDPKIAVEVLIGHGVCHVIVETSAPLLMPEAVRAIHNAIRRIAGLIQIDLTIVPQDTHLANNQSEGFRCGDNGIFKGCPRAHGRAEDARGDCPRHLRRPIRSTASTSSTMTGSSSARATRRRLHIEKLYPTAEINPLGDWTGGTDVDTGASNRKLGSDMADSVTGGGLHGKDLSKADVSVNIYAFLKAQETGEPVELCCAIGDDAIDGKPYEEIVEIARQYIQSVGGFEAFAEWGLY